MTSEQHKKLIEILKEQKSYTPELLEELVNFMDLVEGINDDIWIAGYDCGWRDCYTEYENKITN